MVIPAVMFYSETLFPFHTSLSAPSNFPADHNRDPTKGYSFFSEELLGNDYDYCTVFIRDNHDVHALVIGYEMDHGRLANKALHTFMPHSPWWFGSMAVVKLNVTPNIAGLTYDLNVRLVGLAVRGLVCLTFSLV